MAELIWLVVKDFMKDFIKKYMKHLMHVEVYDQFWKSLIDQ